MICLGLERKRYNDQILLKKNGDYEFFISQTLAPIYTTDGPYIVTGWNAKSVKHAHLTTRLSQAIANQHADCGSNRVNLRHKHNSLMFWVQN